jgi:hypothetical protein
LLEPSECVEKRAFAAIGVSHHRIDRLSPRRKKSRYFGFWIHRSERAETEESGISAVGRAAASMKRE